MLFAEFHASSFERRVNVVLSVRWIKQSLTYWSYVTAQGPSPLSVSGKRRSGSSLSLRRVVSWYGSRFGVALRRLKSLLICIEKSYSRLSTHGGMSDKGGDHFDLTYSLGGWLVYSSFVWWERKTLRWMSR